MGLIVREMTGWAEGGVGGHPFTLDTVDRTERTKEAVEATCTSGKSHHSVQFTTFMRGRLLTKLNM